ncbi:MAG TPA: ribosome maturation factor RimM [Gaiellaceae bacterium]|nr:ribosome maturation factor RimM [Gaiellaceae bacterium]
MSTEGERLVVVGRVGRPHGTDGSFVVEGGSGDLRRFAAGATVLVDGEPATVASARRVGKGRLAVRLDRPARRGAELAVRRADLPPPEEGAYYVADLVGLEVVEEGRRVGVVRDVLPGPANDVLELDTGLLLPLVEACVREVDLEAGRVLLNPGFTD